MYIKNKQDGDFPHEGGGHPEYIICCDLIYTGKRFATIKEELKQ